MNIQITKLTVDQLLLSSVYIGDTSKFLNEKLKPYIFGYKNSCYILNIANTIIQFKLLISIILNIIVLRQKILIVRDSDFFKFSKLLFFRNVFYYDKKWIGGVLTNFRKVRRSSKFLQANTYKNTLRSLRYMPSLVFLFDINISYWALLECSRLEIPISSIINSNSKLVNLVNYPIIGNNRTFEAVYLYLNIIRNAVLKGRQKEKLKILRIL